MPGGRPRTKGFHARHVQDRAARALVAADVRVLRPGAHGQDDERHDGVGVLVMDSQQADRLGRRRRELAAGRDDRAYVQAG